MMSNENAVLPTAVMRPLYGAAIAVIVFLFIVFAWAQFAPLSTSMSLTGQIVSRHPAFEIQHPYGGQIGRVLVMNHDDVRQGDPLLVLDNGLVSEKLEALKSLQERLFNENYVIENILKDEVIHQEQRLGYGAQYILHSQQVRMRNEIQSATSGSLEQQVVALVAKADRDERHLSFLRGRIARQVPLVAQGTISEITDEALRTRVLSLESDMLSGAAQLYSLKDQLSQSQNQEKLSTLTFHTELAAILSVNEKRLQELQHSIFSLQDQLSHSEVLAPVDGTITELHFQAKGMYAPRGATLVSMSRPLEEPHVEFNVNPNLIDQLRPGLRGKLIIPGLPQRNMPTIGISIHAISPRAQQDETGASTGYSGLAHLDSSSVEELQKIFGSDFLLREDMPVNVIIEGRSTTLTNYLVAPFWAAFNRAFED